MDVLEVADADLEVLPDDATDRLHVLSHAWAAETATPLLVVTDAGDPVPVLVAQPAALVAMKLQSVMNRGAAKEGTDLLDIVQLATDPSTVASVVADLRSADAQLRSDALLHSRRWFTDGAGRTLRRIQSVPEGVHVTLDDLELVAELLVAALES